eukprot:8878977-Lingulodinium_polyedra.AAC.1
MPSAFPKAIRNMPSVAPTFSQRTCTMTSGRICAAAVATAGMAYNCTECCPPSPKSPPWVPAL